MNDECCELCENAKIVDRLKNKINRMERAEVDVQNWLSEEGHKIHLIVLKELQSILVDNE